MSGGRPGGSGSGGAAQPVRRRPTQHGSPNSSPVAPGFLSLKSPKKQAELALSADGHLDVLVQRATDGVAPASAVAEKHWCVLRDAKLACYKVKGAFDPRTDVLPAQASAQYDLTLLRCDHFFF